MEVHFAPDLEQKLKEIAARAGQDADALVQDVVAGYVDEVAAVRAMLDGRYDDIKTGRTQLIDGGDALTRVRQRIDSHRADPS
jgi:hypothetical protein